MAPTAGPPPAVDPDPPSALAPTTIPPLPATAAPAVGSIFNLPGLEDAFPMVPSNLPGFSVVPLPDAGLAAAALAGSAKVAVPGVTPLQDGSTLVAVPAPAVSLARLSQPCYVALAGEARRRVLRAALRAASRIVKRPDAEESYAQLAQALATLQQADVGACDATLAAAVTSVTQLLQKRRASTTAREAVELTYRQHAQEFRAMKQDLTAMTAVLRIDAQAVDDARRRDAAAQTKLSRPLLDGVSTLGRYLQQLEVIGAHLN